MKAITIHIFDEEQKDLVFKYLDELRFKKIIGYSQKSSHVMPGEPMTHEEIDELIDEAMKGPFYSVEEARKILNIPEKEITVIS